jgi:hypothetical protein
MREDDIRHYHEVERTRYLAALKRLGRRPDVSHPNYRDCWTIVGELLRRQSVSGRRR